ncbi:F0F1 ATP synthase subunit delta [Chloroflexota bacterium]
MASSAFARNQAQAVFKIALGEKELNRWQSDLRKVASLVKDETLFTLLQNPEVDFDDKAKVLSDRLGDINPQALKLVSQLVAKGRLGLIDDIVDEYQRLVDNYRGVEGADVAEVTTAIPLDDEDRLRLAHHLTSLVGKPVVLKAKVDASLIGGIMIRVGDKLIDGSIRNKLEALKREISAAAKK